jgi:hypothetical protein
MLDMNSVTGFFTSSPPPPPNSVFSQSLIFSGKKEVFD